MAGTRTNALVSAGASAFVMFAFLARDNSRGEAQIVSYVVSGVGFLGAGVIFKDAGSVRGLNTAATIWCSAAIGAICGLGAIFYAATLCGAVLLANVALRPLAYKLHPIQQTNGDQEVTYAFELVCRAEDEAHIRALLLQALARTPLSLIHNCRDTRGVLPLHVVEFCPRHAIEDKRGPEVFVQVADLYIVEFNRGREYH
jgi:putative Mg2+ transporter-C (MgtC) family protein